MADELNRALALSLLADFGKETEELFRIELDRIGLGETYPSGVEVDLYKSVKSVVSPKMEVSIEMLAHWFWVVKGRRSRAENPSAKPPPFKVILDWIKNKRKFQFTARENSKKYQKGQFMSFNDTAILVRAAIWKNGVKPRNFVKPAVEATIRLWDDKISNEIYATIIEAAGAGFFKQRLKKGTTIKLIK